MGVFNLKYRDTRPVLEVTCLQPDGTAYDLTGSNLYLHIKLNDGTYLKRTMIVDPDQVTNTGKATYTWLASDWNAGSGGTGTKPDPYTIGGLIVGPSIPLAQSESEHQMEYEAVNSDERLTFPNGPSDSDSASYDTLRVVDDRGQGA